MFKPNDSFTFAEQQEIARINAAEMLGNALEVQQRDYAYEMGLSFIPAPKQRFAIRFKRIEQFAIDVLARNADEAYAEAIKMFQTEEGRARLLSSMLDYFTAENLSKLQGE